MNETNETKAEDESSAAERGRRGRLALVLSILLNVIGVAYFWHLFGPLRERIEERSPTEVVTIEKRPPTPPPIVIRPPAVVPVPRVVPQQPAPAAVAPAARAPRIAPETVAPKAIPRPAELAKKGAASHARPVEQPAQAGVVASHRAQLSAQKIAQITQDLQGEIDADRGAHGALAVAPEPAPTMKHYATDLSDLTAGELNHHGLCDPTKDWRADGYDYYYVACNVRFSDGTMERQDVPWPVRFRPGDDPFAGTSHGSKPLAMPLPGWHLGPGETVTVELREYAHDHGVDL